VLCRQTEEAPIPFSPWLSFKHSWAFYQLKEMIRYKAEMDEVRFEEVKAEYTSFDTPHG
jgi:hypothetical protein